MIEFGEGHSRPSELKQALQVFELLSFPEDSDEELIFKDAVEKLGRYAFNLAGPDFYPPGQTHMSGETPNAIQRRENSTTKLQIAIPQDEGNDRPNVIKYYPNLQSDGFATVGEEIEGEGRQLLDVLYNLTDAKVVRDDSLDPECSDNGIILLKGVYLGTTVYFKELWGRGKARSGEDVQINYAFIIGNNRGEKDMGALVSSDIRKIEEAEFKLNDLIKVGATHQTLDSALGVLRAARLAVNHSKPT